MDYERSRIVLTLEIEYRFWILWSSAFGGDHDDDKVHGDVLFEVNQEETMKDAVGEVIEDVTDKILLVQESGDMMRGEKDATTWKVFCNFIWVNIKWRKSGPVATGTALFLENECVSRLICYPDTF